MAKRSVASLVLQLRADNRGLVKGFRGAGREANKFTANIGRAARVAGAAAVALGGAAVVGAVATLRKMATEMDAISKRADRLNIATEALTALDFQAGQAGVSTRSLDRALRNVQDRSTQAAQGQKALAEAFGTLGLNAAEIARQQPDVALGNIADALNDIENPAQRTALAMDILGERAGVELATLLKSGSEGIEEFRRRAETLGLTFSRQVGAQMEAFNDSLDVLRQLALGAARQFAVNFAPVMQAFARLIFDNEGAVADLRNAVAVDLADGVARAIRFLLNLPNVIQGVFAEFGVSIAQARVDIATSVQGMLGPLKVLAGFIENTPGRWSPIGVALRQIRDDAVDLAGAQHDLARALETANDTAEATRLGDEFFENYQRGKEAIVEVERSAVTALPPIKKLNDELQNRRDLSGFEGPGRPAVLPPPDPGPWEEFAQRIADVRARVEELGVATAQNFSRAVGDSIGRAVTQAENLGQAVADIAKAVLERAISAFVQLGVQMAIVEAVGRTAVANAAAAAAAGTSAVAGTVAAAAQGIAAAWAPAALAASVATLGAASAIGSAAYLSSLAAATAATVAAQGLTAATGAFFGAVQGQAHDGLDRVPRTGTYLLEAGEGVVDKHTNQGLRDMVAQGARVNVYNYGSQSVDVREGPDGVDVIVREVERRFLRQAKSGRGRFARGLAWGT